MGEQRLPHLHSLVVRRVDEDIKIITEQSPAKQTNIFPFLPCLSFLCDSEQPCRSASRDFQGPRGFLIARLMTLIIACRS